MSTVSAAENNSDNYDNTISTQYNNSEFDIDNTSNMISKNKNNENIKRNNENIKRNNTNTFNETNLKESKFIKNDTYKSINHGPIHVSIITQCNNYLVHVSIIQCNTIYSTSFLTGLNNSWDNWKYNVNVTDVNVTDVNVTDVNVTDVNVTDVNVTDVNVTDVNVTDVNVT
ncbi:hypothetical protein, partial [Methanosphaera sp.]